MFISQLARTVWDPSQDPSGANWSDVKPVPSQATGASLFKPSLVLNIQVVFDKSLRFLVCGINNLEFGFGISEQGSDMAA